MSFVLSIAFLCSSILLTKLFCKLAQGTRLMDKPNNRSMHSTPTVRGGGLIFIGLALLSFPILCYFMQQPLAGQFIFILAILLIAGVSFLDDLYGLSAKTRFLIQILVALLIALTFRLSEFDLGFFSIHSRFLLIPLIFILIVGAINHFNFMDGLDGFCVSQAIFLLASYSILFANYGEIFYQNFCFILIAGLIGFLVFNFPPAKLFMGDVGSATLGLITFYIALIGQQKCHIPIFYWFMLNSIFLCDASLTLIRRVIKKENWSLPHKKHAYQRLRQSGVPVPMILLGQLLMNLTFLSVVLLFDMSFFKSVLIFILQIGFLFVIYYLIEKIFPMFRSELSA